MIPSQQNPSWLLSTTNVFLILLLHFFYSTGSGVGGAKFTIANSCSQPIWPVVLDNLTQKTAEYELPIGSSVAFQRPNGWGGRVWGKTGCIFNESGSASCATGDTTVVTLAEFQLRQGPSGSIPIDFYDVSLVDGYNLPLVVKPIGGSGSCESAGCIEDLNKSCPPELRTENGSACQGPCTVFKTSEYCCTGGLTSCRPTYYSQVFKKVCPRAYSYPYDDATSTFTCTDADYSLTFCATSYDSSLGMPPALSPSYPPHSLFNNNPQRRKGKNRAKEIITSKSSKLFYICICFITYLLLQDHVICSPYPAVVSVIISGVFIVSIAICCFLKRRHSKNRPKRKCNQDVENILLQHGSLAPKRYRYSEIKKITKSLNDKLGRGGYGSVYKGMLPDGRLVAVKILIETDSNGEEFMNEVASISRTSHVNIVTLLGFCYEGDKRALVYEFMPNKSLDKFLCDNGDCFLDLKKLYEIAVGISKGLEYLHTGCTTRIVHFDIKPQNILLDEDLFPKISDFGLAKLCKKKQSVLSVIGTRGTAGYIAPEVFSRNFGGVSHKSDVYSYGMMLLEMAGARKFVETEVIQSEENYFPDKIYEQVIRDVFDKNLDNLMMEEEEETRRKMFVVGFWCIQTIPSKRPSISKVVEMLEGSLDSIQIPPKPFLFSPVIPDLETSSSFSAHVETHNLAQD